MDHAEEQQMELEGLDAMFGEFLQVQNSSTPVKFRLAVDADEAIDLGREPVHFVVTLPETYPEQVPELVVQSSHLLPVLEAKLKDHLLQTAEEMLGSPMIFDLVSAAKDWLEEHSGEQVTSSTTDAAEADDEEDEQNLPKVEGAAFIRRPKDGKPVTVESFVEWRDAFEAEMVTKGGKSKEAKKTGRQLFEENEDLSRSDFFTAEDELADALEDLPEDEDLDFEISGGFDLEGADELEGLDETEETD